VAVVGLARAFSHVAHEVPASKTPTGTIVFSRQLSGSDYDYLFTADPDGSNEARLVPPSIDVFSISPDGRWVLYPDLDDARAQWALPGIVHLDGSDRRVLPSADLTLQGLWPDAWSPDGARFMAQGLAELGSPRAGIYTLRASDGRDPIQVTSSPGPGNDHPIAYSPDGSRILFFRPVKAVSGGAQDLFVVNADGFGLHQLNPPETTVGPLDPGVGGNAVAGQPVRTVASWSPDGRYVTFVAVVGSPGEDRSGEARRAVYVVDADGSDAHRITPWGEIPGAQWSPDGLWIAFSRPSPDVSDIFVVHPDGSGLRALTSSAEGLGSFGPVWSPDGAHLLFARNPDGGEFRSELWIEDVDGSHFSQVTEQPAEYYSYGWSPAVRTS
jgi:TolB protein